MRIVLDTNVLLVTLGKQSPFRWLFDAILNGTVTLLVTDDILREYEEVITRQTDSFVAENVLKAITKLPNTVVVTVYYHWQLITADPDDDKFADCAFCANADFLITHDKHFKVLQQIDFPNIVVLDIFELEKLMTK